MHSYVAPVRSFAALGRLKRGRALHRRRSRPGIAFLIAMVGVAFAILGGLYLLFRDDYPSDEAKKRRKRLLVSNWK